MKILFASSEAVPYAKTGGLADVSGALPRALAASGVDVSVFVPLYPSARGFSLVDTGCAGRIDAGGRLTGYSLYQSPDGMYYFIDCPELFDRDGLYGTKEGEYADNALRFSMFSRAVLESAGAMLMEPDVVHANDWQTGLIPLYMKTLYAEMFADAASLMTIHNLGYQGHFPPSAITVTGLSASHYNPGVLEFYGKLNYLKAGIVAADMVNTVSKTYAEEILAPAMGFGLDGVLREKAGDLRGIVNGLDYAEWDPSTDKLIPSVYSSGNLTGKAACKREFSGKAGFTDAKRPIAGVVSRLVYQKGMDIVADTAREMVAMGYNLAVLGTGEPAIEERFAGLGRELAGRFWLCPAYDERAAHEVYAASDVFLMPSRYEPCGLSQLIAMRYGSLPVAHATGGIVDTVIDSSDDTERTGFTFAPDDSDELLQCLRRALDIYNRPPAWKSLMGNAMGVNYSWDHSAGEYIALYEDAMDKVRFPGVSG